MSFIFPSTIYDRIYSHILPQFASNPDKLIWGLTTTGKFTVQTCYKLIHKNINQHQDTSPIFKHLWKLQLPPKLKFFLWLFTHQRLPTASYLHYLNIAPQPTCKFCNHPNETIFHIFFECVNATQCWNALGFREQIRQLSTSAPSLPHLLNHLLNHKSIVSQYPSKLIIPFTLWHIWLTRNKNTFERTRIYVNYHNILRHTQEYFHLAYTHTNKTKRVPIHLRWLPPHSGYLKLNIDGATSSSNIGFGGIFRNSMGAWVMGFAGNLYSHLSPENAELYALLQALKYAIQYGYNRLEIHTDCKAILSLLSSSNQMYSHLINDCRYLLQQLLDYQLSYTYREQNVVADCLAKHGLTLPRNSTATFLESPPLFVLPLFNHDMEGRTRTRLVDSTPDDCNTLLNSSIILHNRTSANIRDKSLPVCFP